MKKLLYAAIVAFLFVGGLAAGVVHKEMQKAKTATPGDAAAVPTEATGLSLADLGASTPTEGLPNSETLNLEGTPTAVAAAPTPEEMASDAGRSFGGGDNTEPVSSGGSGSSGGSSGSSMSSSPSTWSEPAATPKKKNREVDTFTSTASIPETTEFSGGTIIEDPPIEPVATPRKGGKGTKVAAVAAPVEDDLGMPTVDDSGSGSSGPDPFASSEPATDPFASSGNAASAPTPDPFAMAASTPAPMVAMAMPSGGGDLVFGAASKRPALVKVGQKQNGSSSVVMIELAGSAKYKIIQLPKRRQVWIDFEGVEVPGGGSSVGGSAAHVREISAKFISNESGSGSYARIIVQLDDSVVQMNEKGKEELAVTPNRGTGETNKLTLTIGAKSQQF